MGKATVWVLEGEPKDIVITDKHGEKRHPDLDKVRKNSRLKGTRLNGRFGAGVGPLFYGGRLGLKGELEAQGNKYTTNEAIMEAIGYRKTSVEIDSKS